jgi:site-specific recombinase XerD
MSEWRSELATVKELRPLLRPWLVAIGQRSKATAASYRTSCERFLDSLGLAELDPDSVAGYLESLEELQPSSRATQISAVRSFIRFCQSQGVVEKSPLDLLIRPRVQLASLNRYLTEEEARQVIRTARQMGPFEYALTLFLFTTGARISEAAGLVWRDVYLDPQGRRGVRVTGKGTKTRMVKLLDETFTAIALLHGTDELDASDKTPVFQSPRGGAYSTTTLWRRFRQIVTLAGITKPASPHWARHTFATLSAVGGATLGELKADLGHARYETVEVYLHLARGLEHTAADSLPSLT